MKTELFNKIAAIFGEYRIKKLSAHNTSDGRLIAGNVYRGKTKVADLEDDGLGAGLFIHFTNDDEQKAFYDHAEKVTPTKARMYRDKPLYVEPHEVAECCMNQLIRLTEQIKIIRTKSAKCIVFVDPAHKENGMTEFDHIGINAFGWFALQAGSNRDALEEVMPSKYPQYVFIGQDVRAF